MTAKNSRSGRAQPKTVEADETVTDETVTAKNAMQCLGLLRFPMCRASSTRAYCICAWFNLAKKAVTRRSYSVQPFLDSHQHSFATWEVFGFLRCARLVCWIAYNAASFGLHS